MLDMHKNCPENVHCQPCTLTATLSVRESLPMMRKTKVLAVSRYSVTLSMFYSVLLMPAILREQWHNRDMEESG